MLYSRVVHLCARNTPSGESWTPENGTQTEAGVEWEQPSATTARSYSNGARTYYNFRAATAGTTNAEFISGIVPGSICPKKWSIPAKDDFANLITTIYNLSDDTGSTSLHSVPLEFIYTGSYVYSSGSLDDDGEIGRYWSRTADSVSFAYNLTFNKNNISPQNRNDRGFGFAIRCLAKP